MIRNILTIRDASQRSGSLLQQTMCLTVTLIKKSNHSLTKAFNIALLVKVAASFVIYYVTNLHLPLVTNNNHKHQLQQVRNQMGGGAEVSPALFQKLEKSALIFVKNAVIAIIYGLNFSFKMQFLRVCRRKNRRSFPVEPFFPVLYMIIYQSPLIPRKLPPP